MFKAYTSLTKPGMIRGNAVIAAAGFLLASKGHINMWLLLEMLVGLSLVIASGCVFNNYIDRSIDKDMARTKKRTLVQGKVTNRNALIFATILAVLGIIILIKFTNTVAVTATLIGLVVYVAIYSPMKHRSIHAALVGSIAGAVPPVVGYTAVSHHLDLATGILFLILVLWQMPHFYSIALYRFNDYSAASVPVFPIKKGIFITKIHILMYISVFIGATLSLTLFGYTGYIYAGILLLVGSAWFIFALKGFAQKVDTTKWARTMFFYSLLVIMVFSITISLNSFLI